MTEDIATLKSGQSVGLTPDEIWLQDSEARLDSMEMLLKSVKRNIDALSEKLPSPRISRVPRESRSDFANDNYVHETGCKNYVLSSSPTDTPQFSPLFPPVLPSSEDVEVVHVEHHRMFYNLGLGSHTIAEPLTGMLEENEPDVCEVSKPTSCADLHALVDESDEQEVKPWRSPADFRTRVSADDFSPPTSPAFGETNDVVSLKNILIHSENVDAYSGLKECSDAKLMSVYGSSHTLPTIEENSEEDRAMTDSENADSSLSTEVGPPPPPPPPGEPSQDSQIFKSAEDAGKDRSTLPPPDLGAQSYESVTKCANVEDSGRAQSPRKQTTDKMNACRQTGNLEARRSFERPRSGSPFLTRPKSSTEPQGVSGVPSLTSLRSRDSMIISDAESYMTVRSHIYPSSSCEEAYITACSDLDCVGAVSDDEDVRTFRAHTSSRDDWRRGTAKEKPSKLLVLQQTPNSDYQQHPDDVLEFTLVEAECDTAMTGVNYNPNPADTNRFSDQGTLKHEKEDKREAPKDKNGTGVRRRALRKRTSELGENPENSDSGSCGSNEFSNPTSSSDDEAEYDAGSRALTSTTLPTNYPPPCDLSAVRSGGAWDRSQPSWKRLSRIEEKSCVTEGSGGVDDLDLDSAEEADAVVHFVEMGESTSSPHLPLDNQNSHDRPSANQVTSVPSSTNQTRRPDKDANQTPQSDQTGHSLADSDEQATTTGSESQATTISVHKPATPQSTPEVVVPKFSRFPEEVLIPLRASKVDLSDQQSTDSDTQDGLVEEREDTLKMSIMLPNTQVRDIPEGKKQHLQHRHYVSALDETLQPEVELVSSRKGSSRAVATSQVMVQSPRGLNRPSATAIVQAEATAALGSVAAARATAKATGLASESAAALAREARRLASPGMVVTHESPVPLTAGTPATIAGVLQPESTDDDEAEYDITVSTSCRVTRHAKYSFAGDIPQISSPHPHSGLILSPHNGISPHSSQSPDPLSLPALGLIPQPYSRQDVPTPREHFFTPRTDVTQRLPVASMVRFEKTVEASDLGPTPSTEDSIRHSRSVERDDFVTPVRRARRDCLQSPLSDSATAAEDVFFMGDSAKTLPSVDVLSAPGGSSIVAVVENDKKAENGKVTGDLPEEEEKEKASTKPLYQRRYWQPRTTPCEKEANKASYRSRSVSRLPDRHISATQRASEQANASNQAGQMYSRSSSRYRSTDIDTALASSRDNLMGSSYTDATKKEDYVTSLFDLTGRRPCHGGLKDFGLPRYPSNHLNGKSTNSLLETDIDTGEHMEQPIILETDVDTLQTYRLVGSIGSGQQDGVVISPEAAQGKDKSYSLFNLTSICTPGLHRRFVPGGGHTLPATGETVDVYKRTQSLQGIPDGKGALDDTKTPASRSFAGGGNSRGLIARLRARARSNHELRVAESLTRLDLPEWLDKADLSKPVFSHHESRLNSLPPEDSTPRVERDAIPRYSLREQRTAPISKKEAPPPVHNDISSTRPPICTASSRIRTIETVSSPTWSVAPSKETHELKRPLRPSELLRQRDSTIAKGLTPITSKLRSSMRSSSEVPNGTRLDRGTLLSSSLRDQPDSRTSTAAASSVLLNPDDFLTREQKLWNLRPAPLKATKEVPSRTALSTTGGALSSAEIVRAPKTLQAASDLSTTPTPRPVPRATNRKSPQDCLVRINGDTHIIPDPQELQIKEVPKCTSAEGSIKMADCDATDSEAFDGHLESGFYQPMGFDRGFPGNRREDGEECIYEEVKRPKTRAPPPPPHLVSTLQSPPHNGDAHTLSPLAPPSPSWRSIDEGGETETQATDGFDKISDLTCLTDLLDRCAGRHLTLLQNRPSALETLLAQIGWWPSVPSAAKSERVSSSSADTIALAAGHFDVKEDGHRHEFLALLASPSSQRPIELTEFGLDQVRSGLERNPRDGMLYLRCNNPDCPRVGPTRADKARSWVTCPNCFTAYCSATCRQRAPHAGDVCSFGRARLVCGRILHQLAPCQQVSLTVLAKAGFARLGRGGIVLAFSSVQNAEFFFTYCNALPNHPGADSFLPSAGETTATRPSPSGLMAPPIYLTLEELNELDSRVAAPCRTYSPNNSFVLIVIVCAYDIQTVGNGRAVHFFKQGRILPFPVSYQPHTTDVVRKPAFEKRGGVSESSLGGWTPVKTTREERELFLKRLQRTLRERGLSLRHHHADVYQKLEHFVETGEPFTEVELSFHDYIADQEVLCVIAPMKEAVLQVTEVARQRAKNKPTTKTGVTETGQQQVHAPPHKTASAAAAAAMKLPANRQMMSRPQRGVETEL